MNRGWIRMWRSLLDDIIRVKSNPRHKNVLIACLLSANHKANIWEWKGKKYELQPGQFITSMESLANKSGSGVKTHHTRNALIRFQKLGFLNYEGSSTSTLVTINKWEIYQPDTIVTTEKKEIPQSENTTDDYDKSEYINRARAAENMGQYLVKNWNEKMNRSDLFTDKIKKLIMSQENIDLQDVNKRIDIFKIILDKAVSRKFIIKLRYNIDSWDVGKFLDNINLIHGNAKEIMSKMTKDEFKDQVPRLFEKKVAIKTTESEPEKPRKTISPESKKHIEEKIKKLKSKTDLNSVIEKKSDLSEKSRFNPGGNSDE